MLRVSDETGMSLWDFRYARTVSVFGSAGSGKTIFARHVVKTWVREGGTVLVGGRFAAEYDDLSSHIHFATPDEAVAYGQALEAAPLLIRRANKLLIVVDDWSRLSDESQDYLDEKPESGIYWVVIRQRARRAAEFNNIGIGRLSDGDVAMGFGREYVSENPRNRRLGREAQQGSRGMTTQRGQLGSLVEREVPDHATKPLVDGHLYARYPLLPLPKRVWYAA